MIVAGLAGYDDLTVLRRHGDTLVARARAADGDAVLIKTHARDLPTSDTRERLRREAAMTSAATHDRLPSVRELIDLPTRAALVLDDPGDVTLADALRDRAIDRAGVLDVAVDAATALAALHARGVVHRAVDADHLVLTSKGAVLVDLYDACATGSRPRSSDRGEHPAAPADPRTDQAALAATIRHAFAELGAEVPPGVAAILDRAGHTDARQRFRSMLGLLVDLRHGRDLVGRGEPCLAFPLDTTRVALTWDDPTRVIGREAVLAELAAVVAAVTDDHVGRVVVLRGPSGSGRSVVLAALCDRLAEGGVVCGLGRFDEGGPGVPLRAPLEMMEQVVAQLLASPEDLLQGVRDELHARVGADLAIAIQLVPAIGHLVGPQPEMAETTPEETVARVERALRSAVASIAERAAPLVAVFDDADRIDETSRQTLLLLSGHPDTGPLVTVLGARPAPSGIDPAIERLRQRGVVVHEIDLPPIEPSAMRELVAEGTGTSVEEIAPLADAVWARSAGNPRVALADLWLLVSEGEVWVDVDTATWHWTDEAIEHGELATAADVALGRVRRLDDDVRELLVGVAVAGRAASVPMLARWLAIDVDDVLALVDRGTVARVFARDDAGAPACVDSGIRWAALHEVPADQLAAAELGIGRAIVAGGDLSSGERAEVIRLLLGKPEVRADRVERDRLVDLCDEAARTAHRGGAFRIALDLQRAAIDALGPDAWTGEQERTFDLHLRAAEHALMVDEHELADELLDRVRSAEPSALQRVRAMRVLGMRAWTREEHGRGLDDLRGLLRELGEPIPARPGPKDITRELAAARLALGTKEPEWFLTAPALEDERLVAALDAMIGCVHLAYVDQPMTHVLLVLRGVKLTARHGVADASAYFLAAYGMLSLSIRTGHGIERGMRFGRVAVELAARTGTHGTMVGFAYNAFIRHWGDALAATVEPMATEFDTSLRRQQWGYALPGGTFALLHGLLAGRPLPTVEADVTRMAAEFERLGERAFLQRVQVVRQAVRDLRSGRDGDVLDGAEFSTSAWSAARPRRGELALIVHTVRAFVALCVGDEPALRDAVAASKPLLRSAPGQAVVGMHAFHVAYLDALDSRSSSRRSLRTLRRLAEHAPVNHAHRVAFVEAIVAEDREADAMERYDTAVTSATANGALPDLGVIAERAARYLHGRGRHALARHYATVAHDAWSAWGATALGDSLPSRLPLDVAGHRSWVADSEDAVDDAVVQEPVASDPFAETSRLLGQELEVRDFLERLVEILMRHADATRGFLVLQSAAGPVVEVAARLADDVVAVTPDPSPELGAHAELCIPAVSYVLRTRDVLSLVEPADDRRFRADVALRERSPRAMLCLPIGRPNATGGVLVLESDTYTHAFDPDRVEALRVLSAQAISAVDNARLSSDLSSLNNDVAELRATASILTTKAETDALTGVANRMGLESKLQAAIRQAQLAGAGEGQVGVLFCDLDGFKAVNDEHGHAAGDRVLSVIAARLRSVVRADDIVARVGGDEFVVVSVGVANDELARMADRALREIAMPMTIEDAGPIRLSASIGAGRAPLDHLATTGDLDALVQVADEAMYRAKHAGKNQVDLG